MGFSYLPAAGRCPACSSIAHWSRQPAKAFKPEAVFRALMHGLI
jgi:hypothetical protein